MSQLQLYFAAMIIGMMLYMLGGLGIASAYMLCVAERDRFYVRKWVTTRQSIALSFALFFLGLAIIIGSAGYLIINYKE